MRRILNVLSAALTILLLTSISNAKDISDWKAVEKLKPGAEILVIASSGSAEGRLTAVNDQDIRMEERDRGATGFLTPRTFARAEVREVYKAGKKLERRMTGRQVLLSSAVGALVGVGIGAAYDSAHPNSEDPGQGKLIFGTIGFFVGPAATALGRVIYSATHRHKLIYRKPPVGQPNDSVADEPTEPKRVEVPLS